jgi:serine/threonine-protein kinase
VNPRLPTALDAVVARALAKTCEERFATARDFAVALQAAIRRAEDQTVVPPANPNRKLEAGASRPLTAPGGVPSATTPGGATTPSVTGSTVTQELELVYWKDVKDSSDPEELQGFLEKFPAGIYADLARRRLRKLAGGDQTVISQPGLGGNSVFAVTQFPDSEATRVRTDGSRPSAADEGGELRPVQWADEEYTRTLVLPGAATAPEAEPDPSTVTATVPAAAAAPAAALPAAAAPAVAAPSAPVQPLAAAVAQEAPEDDESAPLAPAARKRMPVALLAGVGVLALAGMLALFVGRGKGTDPAGAQVAASPPAASGAAPAPASKQGASVDVPGGTAPVAAVPALAPAAGPGAKPAASAATASRKQASQPAKQAKTGVPATEIAATPAPAPRPDPEPAPRPAPAPVAANTANYQAVEQCKERMFLTREICLSENCGRPGARNHPLCVRYREDVRLREESKQPRGP